MKQVAITTVESNRIESGIELLRYDHSEPQAGKDMCDRILCPLKASIRRYCNVLNDKIIIIVNLQYRKGFLYWC